MKNGETICLFLRSDTKTNPLSARGLYKQTKRIRKFMRNYAIFASLPASWDFFLDAVFLCLTPFATAWSSFLTASLKAASAFALSASATYASKLFMQVLMFVLIIWFLKVFVFITLTLFLADLILGNVFHLQPQCNKLKYNTNFLKMQVFFYIFLKLVDIDTLR